MHNLKQNKWVQAFLFHFNFIFLLSLAWVLETEALVLDLSDFVKRGR